MARKMLASAVFAGFAAGLIAAALQLVLVQPVLLQAELYESGELTHFGGVIADAASAAHDHATHDHAADSAATGGIDIARNGLTVLFSALVYVGYGLVLVAGFALAERLGHGVTARTGIVWGIAGFVAAQLAPAIGLPPELPGSAASELVPRQIWWFATVAATAAGLGLIAFGSGWAHWGLAVLLLLAPHVIGAPQPVALAGVAPPELAGEFAARALGVGLAGWSVLGLVAGHFWSREPA